MIAYLYRRLADWLVPASAVRLPKYGRLKFALTLDAEDAIRRMRALSEAAERLPRSEP